MFPAYLLFIVYEVSYNFNSTKKPYPIKEGYPLAEIPLLFMEQ